MTKKLAISTGVLLGIALCCRELIKWMDDIDRDMRERSWDSY
ncbi:MAG: hypothetical protein QG658_15 [Patescibacteria group bacterium]|jgi:hypothetical protein|nr:hypothetical protein [Patescibacteria group bacterium]